MEPASELRRLEAELAALKAKAMTPPGVIELGYDDLEVIKLLADSGQAKVYRGRYKRLDVAAKVFRADKSDEAALQAFRAEISSLLYGHLEFLPHVASCF
jgi:predicted Ser/Thr protein kinase